MFMNCFCLMLVDAILDFNFLLAHVSADFAGAICLASRDYKALGISKRQAKRDWNLRWSVDAKIRTRNSFTSRFRSMWKAQLEIPVDYLFLGRRITCKTFHFLDLIADPAQGRAGQA